nr:EOG090X06K5 [Artemia franciscana]
MLTHPQGTKPSEASSDASLPPTASLSFRIPIPTLFKLLQKKKIEFYNLLIAAAVSRDNHLYRLHLKDLIGFKIQLEFTDSKQIHQPLVVCTAHIHWDPEYCDVKLIQTMMLMHELKQFMLESGRNLRKSLDPSTTSFLLCGDLNSLPESGVYDFLTENRILMNHPDFKDFGYKSCLQKVSHSHKNSEYTHAFKLASAYTTDIMPFTNYTYDFKGMIDYIFYSRASMHPLGLLGGIDTEWFRENKILGCPHPHIPSDHFPLLVEFEMDSSNQSGINNSLIIPRR